MSAGPGDEARDGAEGPVRPPPAPGGGAARRRARRARGLLGAAVRRRRVPAPARLRSRVVSPLPLCVQRLRGGAASACSRRRSPWRSWRRPASGPMRRVFLLLPRRLRGCSSPKRWPGAAASCAAAPGRSSPSSSQVAAGPRLRCRARWPRACSSRSTACAPRSSVLKELGPRMPAERSPSSRPRSSALHDVARRRLPGGLVHRGGVLVVVERRAPAALPAAARPGLARGRRVRAAPLARCRSSMAFVLAGAAVALPVMRPAAYNVLLVLALLLRAAGAGRRRLLRAAPGRRRRSCARAALVLVLVNPWAPQILALLGLFDIFFDFRQVGRAPEGAVPVRPCAVIQTRGDRSWK